MNQNTLQSDVEACFTALTRRVARRQSHPEEMSWLFAPSNTQPVVPDYLAFGSVGRGGAERFINRNLCRLSPRLWFELFWPKIRRGLLSYIAGTYTPHFFARMPLGPENRHLHRTALEAIEAVTHRNWPDLPRCTFVEFGAFVTEVVHACRIRLGGDENVFREEKQWQNSTVIEFLNQHAGAFVNHPRRLDILLYGCCQTNRIDALENGVSAFIEQFGKNCLAFLSDTRILDEARHCNPFFQFDRFASLIESPPKVMLYECDNCGEVVFDLLLVQYLLERGHQVILGLKARPVLNDATIDDVEGLISADLFAPLRHAVRERRLRLLPITNVIGGKLLYEVSEDYRQAYDQADILLLKGQANFQSMPMGVTRNGRFHPYRYRKPAVYLMVVKSIMARLSLGAIMKAPPALQSMFLYCYHHEDVTSYPH